MVAPINSARTRASSRISELRDERAQTKQDIEAIRTRLKRYENLRDEATDRDEKSRYNKFTEQVRGEIKTKQRVLKRIDSQMNRAGRVLDVEGRIKERELREANSGLNTSNRPNAAALNKNVELRQVKYFVGDREITPTQRTQLINVQRRQASAREGMALASQFRQTRSRGEASSVGGASLVGGSPRGALVTDTGVVVGGSSTFLSDASPVSRESYTAFSSAQPVDTTRLPARERPMISPRERLTYPERLSRSGRAFAQGFGLSREGEGTGALDTVRVGLSQFRGTPRSSEIPLSDNKNLFTLQGANQFRKDVVDSFRNPRTEGINTAAIREADVGSSVAYVGGAATRLAAEYTLFRGAGKVIAGARNLAGRALTRRAATQAGKTGIILGAQTADVVVPLTVAGITYPRIKESFVADPSRTGVLLGAGGLGFSRGFTPTVSVSKATTQPRIQLGGEFARPPFSISPNIARQSITQRQPISVFGVGGQRVSTTNLEAGFIPSPDRRAPFFVRAFEQSSRMDVVPTLRYVRSSRGAFREFSGFVSGAGEIVLRRGRSEARLGRVVASQDIRVNDVTTRQSLSNLITQRRFRSPRSQFSTLTTTDTPITIRSLRPSVSRSYNGIDIQLRAVPTSMRSDVRGFGTAIPSRAVRLSDVFTKEYVTPKELRLQALGTIPQSRVTGFTTPTTRISPRAAIRNVVLAQAPRASRSPNAFFSGLAGVGVGSGVRGAIGSIPRTSTGVSPITLQAPSTRASTLPSTRISQLPSAITSNLLSPVTSLRTSQQTSQLTRQITTQKQLSPFNPFTPVPTVPRPPPPSIPLGGLPAFPLWGLGGGAPSAGSSKRRRYRYAPSLIAPLAGIRRGKNNNNVLSGITIRGI